MSCKIDYLSWKTENLIEETSQLFLCVECSEEQKVDRLCCEDETSKDRFLVKLHEQFTECVKCKSKTVRLPCCKQFQPKQTKENYFMIVFSVANILSSVLAVLLIPYRLNQ